MALDKFQPYLFVSAGEQSNKYLTPVISPDGIASFQAQRVQDIKKLLIRIDPVQAGSGDPSPDNIRPISGRTGMTATRAGKNLFSPDNLIFGYWIRDEWHPGGETWCGTIIPVSEGMQIHISGNKCLGGVNGAWLTSRTDPSAGLTGYTQALISAANNYTLTAPSGALGLWFPQYISKTQPIDMSELQIEYGASATAYEPYTAQTYPISWQTEAGTVYGGTLDVVSGVLTVEYGIFEDDGTANWLNYSGGNGYVIAMPTMKSGNWYNDPKAICNELPKVPGKGTLGVRIGVNNTNIYIVEANSISGVSDAATWKAWLASHPIQIVYPLATPQTYQLTPTEVRTIAGYNQVYSDAGPVIDIKF